MKSTAIIWATCLLTHVFSATLEQEVADVPACNVDGFMALLEKAPEEVQESCKHALGPEDDPAKDCLCYGTIDAKAGQLTLMNLDPNCKWAPEHDDTLLGHGRELCGLGEDGEVQVGKNKGGKGGGNGGRGRGGSKSGKTSHSKSHSKSGDSPSGGSRTSRTSNESGNTADGSPFGSKDNAKLTPAQSQERQYPSAKTMKEMQGSAMGDRSSSGPANTKGHNRSFRKKENADPNTSRKMDIEKPDVASRRKRRENKGAVDNDPDLIAYRKQRRERQEYNKKLSAKIKKDYDDLEAPCFMGLCGKAWHPNKGAYKNLGKRKKQGARLKSSIDYHNAWQKYGMGGNLARGGVKSGAATNTMNGGSSGGDGGAAGGDGADGGADGTDGGADGTDGGSSSGMDDNSPRVHGYTEEGIEEAVGSIYLTHKALLARGIKVDEFKKKVQTMMNAPTVDTADPNSGMGRRGAGLSGFVPSLTMWPGPLKPGYWWPSYSNTFGDFSLGKYVWGNYCNDLKGYRRMTKDECKGLANENRLKHMGFIDMTDVYHHHHTWGVGCVLTIIGEGTTQGYTLWYNTMKDAENNYFTGRGKMLDGKQSICIAKDLHKNLEYWEQTPAAPRGFWERERACVCSGTKNYEGLGDICTTVGVDEGAWCYVGRNSPCKNKYGFVNEKERWLPAADFVWSKDPCIGVDVGKLQEKEAAVGSNRESAVAASGKNCVGNNQNGWTPVGTPCEGPCEYNPGPWGETTCFTNVEKKFWGADCGPQHCKPVEEMESKGQCPSGYELTEKECGEDRSLKGPWKGSITSKSKSCGCFLDKNGRYFNKQKGSSCNKPRSGEKTLCKAYPGIDAEMWECTMDECPCEDYVEDRDYVERMDLKDSCLDCMQGCTEDPDCWAADCGEWPVKPYDDGYCFHWKLGRCPHGVETRASGGRICRLTGNDELFYKAKNGCYCNDAEDDESCYKKGNDNACDGNLLAGQGHCKSDWDCAGELVCGVENCVWNDETGETDNCCVSLDYPKMDENFMAIYRNCKFEYMLTYEECAVADGFGDWGGLETSLNGATCGCYVNEANGMRYYNPECDEKNKEKWEDANKMKRLTWKTEERKLPNERWVDLGDNKLRQQTAWVPTISSDGSEIDMILYPEISVCKKPGASVGDLRWMCTQTSCDWGISVFKEGTDYGQYKGMDGDCEKCLKKCSEDPKCAAFECGYGDECYWWAEGGCPVQHTSVTDFDTMLLCRDKHRFGNQGKPYLNKDNAVCPSNDEGAEFWCQKELFQHCDMWAAAGECKGAGGPWMTACCKKSCKIPCFDGSETAVGSSHPEPPSLPTKESEVTLQWADALQRAEAMQLSEALQIEVEGADDGFTMKDAALYTLSAVGLGVTAHQVYKFATNSRHKEFTPVPDAEL